MCVRIGGAATRHSCEEGTTGTGRAEGQFGDQHRSRQEETAGTGRRDSQVATYSYASCCSLSLQHTTWFMIYFRRGTLAN